MNEQTIKVRLRLKDGSEFEAEGPASLVISEKNLFLSGNAQAASPQQSTPDQQPPQSQGHNTETPRQADKLPWSRLAEERNGIIYLISKPQEATAADAALLITAAAKMVAQIDQLPALQLSKSLKKSGYFQGRLDRITAKEVKNGFLSALGTKRNRAYCLTPKGLARAFALAEKLLADPKA
ncbi:MAG: hypothetical protein GX410_07680 [Elusimicrobia bacterium]|nr:hypothetical protein [Elusimicrobiota bacterium]